MFLNIVNFSLVIAVSLNTILCILLIRQNVRRPVITLYVMLVSLFALDGLALIYLLNAMTPAIVLLVEKLHYALLCFILAGAHFFTANLTIARGFSPLRQENYLVFAGAVLLAGLPFLNMLAPAPLWQEYRYFHLDPAYLVLLIAFFGLVVWQIREKLTSAIAEMRNYRDKMLLSDIARIVFPIMAVLFFVIAIIPYFWRSQPIFFLAVALVSILLYLGAERFQLLELDENNQYVLPQFMVAAAFMLVFNFTLKEPVASYTTFLSIPFLIACTMTGYYIIVIFTSAFKKMQLGYDELLDKKLEAFSKNIIKFMESHRLWQYIADFCRETFDISKIAIVTLHAHHLLPYQVTYIEGFSEVDLDKLLADDALDFSETLAPENELLNKFTYANNHSVFKTMERNQIYLVVPLRRESQLTGVIFLGGEHAYFPIPRRNLHVLKLMSAQISIAMENIRTLESKLQSEKMAGLGMLASQIAHDFRSFISLTQNQNKEIRRLADQAEQLERSLEKSRDGDAAETTLNDQQLESLENLINTSRHQKNKNQRLMRHAEYMEKMVGDLLYYARPEDLKYREININQLIDLCLDRIQKPADIVIEKCYATDLKKVKVDFYQMQRVFVNIIENSIHSMAYSEGNNIKITTREMEFSLSSVNKSSFVHVEITDEGLGIPEEYQGRIFDPFFTTHKKEGGNGLGLAIVKQIIERHAGSIDFASKPGKGTVFNIRLPYQNK